MKQLTKMSKWLILGICGATCGGKSLLAKHCKKYLPNSKVLSQDAYFLPESSPKHVLVPELNHFNWEILSSLDMEKMHNDILSVIKGEKMIEMINITNQPTDDINYEVTLEIIQQLRNKFYDVNILILEGFSIFNYEPIDKICHLKFYIMLSKETCFKRRSKRVYNPPDPPGYFEKVVWPEHVKHRKEVEEKCKNIIYLLETDKNHLLSIFKHLLSYTNL